MSLGKEASVDVCILIGVVRTVLETTMGSYQGHMRIYVRVCMWIHARMCMWVIIARSNSCGMWVSETGIEGK